MLPQKVQQRKGGVDNAEYIIKETSECTVRVRSKIENTNKLSKVMYVTCNLKPFPQIATFYQFLLHAIAT